MKRFDLREHKNNFLERLGEIIISDLNDGEVGIFLFEIGDFSNIQKASDFIKDKGFMMMNSIRFNEVDWTIVIKKEKEPKIQEDKIINLQNLQEEDKK